MPSDIQNLWFESMKKAFLATPKERYEREVQAVEARRKERTKKQEDDTAIARRYKGEPRTFFIADTHFMDEKIIRYENRPFKDVNSMGAAIQENWNRLVLPEDTVWVLGDFCLNSLYAKVCCKYLNGHKFLVKGNHDTESNEFYRRCGFDEVYDHPVILKGFFILSHEPMYINANMPYFNIFGHVHGNPMYRNDGNQFYCVSVERTDYTPVEVYEFEKKITCCGDDEPYDDEVVHTNE